ncbi:MAG TPA: hypothetical protein VM889_13770 [Candidatus Thermoplasmatota archaeon]|nr:hypothetical protein [Candidatus Thermoplasmatota archaeon]
MQIHAERAFAFALALTFVLVAPVTAVATVEKADVPCPGFTDIPGIGPACPVEGGYEILLENGRRLFTHGGDPLPPDLGFEPSTPGEAPIGEWGIFSGVTPRDPVCVSSPLEAHGVLVYAHAADRLPRYAEMAPILRTWMRYVNGLLARDSAEFGLDFRYRMLCDGGSLVVHHAVMPRPASETSFQTIVTDLQAQGYDNPYAKYWIWNDDTGIVARCGCGGTGDFINEPRPSPDNPNNRGPSYGVTHAFMSEWSPFTMMHENGHNLGAVLSKAAASSGAAHCNDGLDVMCYADGGPKSNYKIVCGRYTFDCNRDTYFHPFPPANSVLASHWNLALPTNRYIQGCHYATGRIPGSLNGIDVDRATAVTVDVPPGCGGRAFALYGESLPQTSLSPSNFDVCWYGAPGLMRCDATASSTERGTVPAGATAARIIYRFGAGSAYTLSIQ